MPGSPASAVTATVDRTSPDSPPWIFGRAADLTAFGGSALLSVMLVAVGVASGTEDTPEWVWLTCILAVDVAHVWSTVFRVYLDPKEVQRRRALYLVTPIVCYAGGVLVYLSLGQGGFWRALAYLAVFHFVRQQAGWVTLYRRRGDGEGRVDRWIDTATIYTATVFPLAWWHSRLPRRFHWFVDGDFISGLSAELIQELVPLYWAVLAAFVLRQVQRGLAGRTVNVGKLMVVGTTWLCWWLGIIALNSDFAFTVTNVLIHGIPYLFLTYHYGRRRAHDAPETPLARLLAYGTVGFAATVLALAFCEEWLWDHWIWSERPWLFGEGNPLAHSLVAWVVPLLAVPQLTHYALDGWIWRRAGNPELRRYLA